MLVRNGNGLVVVEHDQGFRDPAIGKRHVLERAHDLARAVHHRGAAQRDVRIGHRVEYHQTFMVRIDRHPFVHDRGVRRENFFADDRTLDDPFTDHRALNDLLTDDWTGHDLLRHHRAAHDFLMHHGARDGFVADHLPGLRHPHGLRPHHGLFVHDGPRELLFSHDLTPFKGVTHHGPREGLFRHGAGYRRTADDFLRYHR